MGHVSDNFPRLVADVEKLEVEIAQVQTVIDNAIERKNAILRNYLYKESMK